MTEITSTPQIMSLTSISQMLQFKALHLKRYPVTDQMAIHHETLKEKMHSPSTPHQSHKNSSIRRMKTLISPKIEILVDFAYNVGRKNNNNEGEELFKNKPQFNISNASLRLLTPHQSHNPRSIQPMEPLIFPEID